MKVVIMAGGRGTRISEMFPDIPKPLILIENIPVLEREIISLRDQGFTDLILTVPTYTRRLNLTLVSPHSWVSCIKNPRIFAGIGVIMYQSEKIEKFTTF